MASYGLVLPEVFPKGTLITDIKQIVTSTDDNGENVIQAELFNGEKVEFKIRNGSKGNTGAAAGFTTPTAEIDNNTGTPSVTVTATGDDTAKKFHFTFKNLKGDKGDRGDLTDSALAVIQNATHNLQQTFKWELYEETKARISSDNAEAQARMQGDSTISGQLSSHAGNKSNPHSVTKVQVGLGNVDNTADKDKSVKYAASARHSDTSNLLQAYTTDDYADSNHFIKAIRESGWNMRLYGCYFNGAKQSDCVKVNYANSAGKAATADSAKNADTVGGYRAGNGVNMLVPVVAFNVGENAGYIKLGNGLIVQWGHVVGDEVDVILPLAYSHYYSISLSTGCHSYSNGWSRTATYENKNLKSFHISVCVVAPIESDWLTIGF